MAVSQAHGRPPRSRRLDSGAGEILAIPGASHAGKPDLVPTFTAQISGPDLESAEERLASAGIDVRRGADAPSQGSEGAPSSPGALTVSVEADDPEAVRARVREVLGGDYSAQVGAVSG